MNSIIDFIAENSAVLNDNFRPSPFQEDEGGGATIEELDTNVYDFVRTDSTTTREVIRRLFGAIPKQFITYKYPDFSEEKKRVYEKYLDFGYCFIDLNIAQLKTGHTFTILRNKEADYLIQSYSDRYSCKITPIDIKTFFDDLINVVQHNIDGTEFLEEYIIYDRSEYNDVYKYASTIKFSFCKVCRKEPVTDLQEAITLMRDESRGYIV